MLVTLSNLQMQHYWKSVPGYTTTCAQGPLDTSFAAVGQGPLDGAMRLSETPPGDTEDLAVDVPVHERSSAVLATIVTVQSMVKVVYFVIKRKEFEKFFELWNNSFADLPFGEERKKMMKKEQLRVKIIAMVLLITIAGIAVSFSLLSLVPFMQELHGGRFLSISAWYPFDYLVSPNFEAVVIFQTIAAVFNIAKSIIFDSFFMSIAALVIVNFQHLNICLENMFVEGDAQLIVVGQSDVSTEAEKVSTSLKVELVVNVINPSPTLESSLSGMPHVPELPVMPEEMNEFQSFPIVNEDTTQSTKADDQGEELFSKLKLWSRCHQEAIEMGNKLHELYSPILLVQFLASTVFLCFSAFIQVGLTNDDTHYLLGACFGMNNMVQLFVLCHYGDRLADASASLVDAGLANGWETCRIKKVTSMLKIIYNRVQRPIQIFAVHVYPLSSETFLAIVKASISYMMVLIEINSKSPPENPKNKEHDN